MLRKASSRRFYIRLVLLCMVYISWALNPPKMAVMAAHCLRTPVADDTTILMSIGNPLMRKGRGFSGTMYCQTTEVDGFQPLEVHFAVLPEM